jgi:TolB protein
MKLLLSKPKGIKVLLIITMYGCFQGTSSVIAQTQDSIPGVTLGLLYESEFYPALAVHSFSGGTEASGLAREIETIIANDLRYSDRFEVMDSIPRGLVGDGIDYELWDQLGAVWLLSGSVQRQTDASGGFILNLELHDIVYGAIHEQGRFLLPSAEDADFRMAVHVASDQLIQWIYGEPGMATSRIAFSRRSEDGNQELYTIDSDGENFRQITSYGDLTMSPTWSPNGEKIAYTSRKGTGLPRIYELDMATREERVLPSERNGDYITPVYNPNGREIAFSVTGGNRSGIFRYNWLRNCCLVHVSGGRWDDLSPTYSPDGKFMAFNSNRLGTPYPQIFVMPAIGGEADLVSPYIHGREGYYTSPDWAPSGDYLAFHGRVSRRGRYQILVAQISESSQRLRQLTREGNNEDPSWAPDARHLVFVGTRDWGTGLMVVDTASGKIRMLLRGFDVRVPEWSPSLRESLGVGSLPARQ